MIRVSFAAAAFVAAISVVTAGARAADDWQAGGGAAWQKVLTAAKQEGKVVVAGHPALGKPLSQGFKRDTGITLEFLGGRTRELTTRFARETRSGNVTVDIILGGGAEFPLLKAGLLKPIKPQLMLPGVTDGQNWLPGKVKWFDAAGQYMLQGTNWVFAYALFNSDVVKPGTVTRWKDLLKPEFKGKIAAHDPRSGGPGQAAAAYLTDNFGIDFVKRLYIGQQIKYTRDGRQLVEWAARGTYPIVLGTVPHNIERFKRKGMKQLTVPTLTDGPGSLVGGFSVLKQAKASPHPNAATVFINWYASKPGQEAYTRRMLSPSLRSDVKVSVVPEYVVPKPGLNYLDQYIEKWYTTVRPRVRKEIVEALGGR
jgi:ABC-type Fe3+ transport system substrate-binding protein